MDPSHTSPVVLDPGLQPEMKVKLCDVNAAALDKLPHRTGDKSGIGVHYVDAYLKPLNVRLEDGSRVKCKRRGLKISLSVGDKTGDGLMRRLAISCDPVVMLQAALEEAAAAAGVTLFVTEGEIFLDPSSTRRDELEIDR
jgi:hypothetical protein